mmetsp:Transcript_46187/g.67463  ORF Transcript_46187/g.67463 Transcript_46187/m.67463 type:complete len:431 (+) Transcript_46187:730-2022(+)
MNTHDRPGGAHVAVGVPAVQREAVVEVVRVLERRGGVRCPLEDLLGPVHAQEAVHLPLRHHLDLRGVPQIVVGAPLRQLVQAVEMLPRVRGVQLERLARPVGATLQAVVVLLVEAEVVRELPAHHRLLHEGGHPGTVAGGALLHLQDRGLGAQLAVVEVGGQVAQGVRVRVVAPVREDLEPAAVAEVRQGGPRRGRPRPQPGDLGHCAVDAQGVDDRVPVLRRGRRRGPRGGGVGGQLRERHQELRQDSVDLGADGARGVLLLGARHPHRHDVVRVHLVQGRPRGAQPVQGGGRVPGPPRGHPQRGHVRHHRRRARLLGEAREDLRRPPAQQVEGDVLLPQLRLHLSHAAKHEAEVPYGCIKKLWNETEHNPQGQALLGCKGACVQQSPVLMGSLVPAHPVDHAPPRIKRLFLFCQASHTSGVKPFSWRR